MVKISIPTTTEKVVTKNIIIAIIIVGGGGILASCFLWWAGFLSKPSRMAMWALHMFLLSLAILCFHFIGCIILLTHPRKIIVNPDAGYISWKVRDSRFLWPKGTYKKYLRDFNEVRIPFSDIEDIIDNHGRVKIVLLDMREISLGVVKEETNREKIIQTYENWKKQYSKGED
ncbi:MAG: hypothetical protein QXD64_07470 [Thermoplasmata archaeon]